MLVLVLMGASADMLALLRLVVKASSTGGINGNEGVHLESDELVIDICGVGV